MDSERILNIILSDIYNAPTSKDFLFYDEKVGNFIVGGQIQPTARCEDIIEQANQLWQNPLFQMLINELEYDGSKRVAVQAGDWERVRFGKAFIYAAALMRDKVDKLRNLQIRKTEKKKVAKKETKKDE